MESASHLSRGTVRGRSAALTADSQNLDKPWGLLLAVPVGYWHDIPRTVVLLLLNGKGDIVCRECETDGALRVCTDETCGRDVATKAARADTEGWSNTRVAGKSRLNEEPSVLRSSTAPSESRPASIRGCSLWSS